MNKRLLFTLCLVVSLLCSCGKTAENVSETEIETETETETVRDKKKRSDKKTEQDSQEEIANSDSTIEANEKSVSKVEPVHPKIACTYSSRIIALQPDGNIIYVNEDSVSSCPAEYKNAVAVYVDGELGSGNTVFILQDDGTVVADYGNSSSRTRDLYERLIASLKNIEDIAFVQESAGVMLNSIVLYKDGTVSFTDDTRVKDSFREAMNEELKSWTDIKQIYYPTMEIVLGVNSNGDVVSCFNIDRLLSYAVGDTEEALEFCLSLQRELNSWTDIKKISAATYLVGTTQFYGLQSDGKIVTVRAVNDKFDENDKFAEREKLEQQKYNETVESLTDVIDIAAHSLGLCALKKDGSVIAVYFDGGEIVTKKLWTDIEEIKAFDDGIIGLKTDGSVVVVDRDFNGGDDMKNEIMSSDIKELSPTESESLDSQKADKAESESDEYIIPNSNSAYLNQEDIKNLSAEELRIARNEIYARHGRLFQSQDLQEYFESKDWYHGTIEPSDFEESLLNDFEKKNAELIKKAEENAP